MNTVKIPKILFPAVDDLSAWAVIACDQFTSDGEYWRNLMSFVGSKPSALNLIFPEIFLNANMQERIERINHCMAEYLSDGIFREEEGLVLVERTTQSGTRTGILLAVDLEDYSFQKNAKTLIRSTEETILERIPPRVEIRKNAPIELPHIMLLYDDRENTVLSGTERGSVIYDFDLNMGGGHIVGTRINNPQEVIRRFAALAESARYGVNDPILFVVGDGNHSLAAAKSCWDSLKAGLSREERETHPARYALVEAVNLHDSALKFEPIHRLVKTDRVDVLIDNLDLGGNGRAVAAVNGRRAAIRFPQNIPEGIRILDQYIASFIKKYGGSVDYIHGDEQLISLSREGVGIMLPPVSKDDLFRLVAQGGNLPRKTFSMGDGNEKRYYIEAKAIR